MRFDCVEFQIAAHFMSWLINGDDSGLSDEESAMVKSFETETRAEFGNGHFHIDCAEYGFAVCDVCKLYADCSAVRFYFPV